MSVTIITRDEEAHIGDCLDAVRWADEIVVVDTGSADRTREICQKYTPYVHSRPWEGYAAAKNAALECATGEWILSVDADERVSAELRAVIAMLLRQPMATLADGFAIPRRNYLWGRWLRHGGLYPDYQVRLFKRGRGGFTARRVHESVQIDGRVTHLTAHLDHYSYRQLGEVIQRLDRYTDLAALDLQYAHARSFRVTALVMRPVGRFLRNYVQKQGFRDGIPGFIMAVTYAYGVFAREAKLWEMAQNAELGPPRRQVR